MFVLEKMTGKGYRHFSASGKPMGALAHISLENIVHMKKSLGCISHITGVHCEFFPTSKHWNGL